jgi:peptide chain release factor subunit 1
MWGTGLARRAVMSAIPTTTAPGPDQARLRDLMRRLAEIESTEAPVLSVYLDVRPEAHAERPAERPQLIEVRERLDSVGRAYEPQTPAAESFAADRARIDELVRGEDLAGVEGVAAFACDAIGLWEVVRAQTPFETHVAVGPTAELFQLAKLLDDQISAVVAVLNTSTCRLFATRRGGLFERSGLDEPSDEHKRHDQGGWSQARFQRHVDMQDKRFAKEAAEAIDRLVRLEKPRHVILAGDERVIPVLERELPEAVRALVAHVTHLGVRAATTEVNDEVAPLLSALEEADDGEVADRAIGAMRAGGLGVAGIDDTMRALEVGQVDELVIDESVEMDEELRAELIRQASLTDARVTVTREHPGLARYEGVAATLRFRI